MTSSELALSIVHSSMRAMRRCARGPACRLPLRPRKTYRSPLTTTYHSTRTLSGNTRLYNKPEPAETSNEKQAGLNTQLATTLQQSDHSDLVSEVRIPEDLHGVLPQDHPAMAILGNSSLVIQRQIEMMNLLLSFEVANRYIIMDGEGQTLGYIAERDHGIGQSLARQVVRTHRSFTTYIFDKDGHEVLRIHRPFSYINSKIRIYDPIPAGGYNDTNTTPGSQSYVANAKTSPLELKDMRIIGECSSQWTALRRKYNLFVYRQGQAVTEAKLGEQGIESHMVQFSMIDEPMLSWDFTVKEEYGKVIGSVNRNFAGFAREIFTDTGVYALRMDAAAQMSADDGDIPALTLDQRAVMIATAVSIDFDYFSRHSGHGPGFMPMFIPMGGAAEGAGAGAVGGAVGEAGAVGAAGAAGRSIAGSGAIESGIAGAGTMAGYEAMQRGVYGDDASRTDDASPQSASPIDDTPQQPENTVDQNDVWGTEQDPWSESTGSTDGGSGGGSWLDTISDWFSD